MYFVSFATINWVDISVKEDYFNVVVESLGYCRANLGMELYCWCIMPSHVHLIFRAKESNPSQVLGRFKEHTSKCLRKLISESGVESRREWLLWMMERAAKKSSSVSKYQFWQHHNKPIELWSADVIEQKVNYIHNNPVAAGFVTAPEHWKYSSASTYCGLGGVLEIDLLW